MRVLAVPWSVREVLGQLREDLCHGQAGKVRVELVERCLRLRVRGRPMEARVR